MTKRFLAAFLMLGMAFSAILAMPVMATADVSSIPAGTVIKGKGNPTLYYVGEDGKRYVFPNSNTYFSWFNDFSKVKEIEMKNLYNYELGGNVTYKPGTILVKIQSDPKVYAVGVNGILRWVKTEKVAKALYGKDWNKLVDDVPDGFFVNYKKGSAIESEDDFEPTEEEEQVPTISNDKKLRPLAAVKARTGAQKMCGRLEGALERLQKRFERWGADLSDEADEVLDKCYGIKDEIIETVKDKKVNVCHKGETLSVGAPAVKGHLRHGDTLDACAAEETTESDDSADDSTGVDDDAQDDSSDSSDDTATTTDDVVDDSSDSSDDTATTTDDVVDDSSDSSDDTATTTDETA